jgi:hypothetical protein
MKRVVVGGDMIEETIYFPFENIWYFVIQQFVLMAIVIFAGAAVTRPIFRLLECKLRQTETTFHISNFERILFRVVPVIVVVDLVLIGIGVLKAKLHGGVLSIPFGVVVIFAFFWFVVFPLFSLLFIFISQIIKEAMIAINIYDPATKRILIRRINSVSVGWYSAIIFACLLFITPMILVNLFIFSAPPYHPAEYDPIIALGLTKYELTLFVIMVFSCLYHTGTVFATLRPLLLNPTRLIPFPILDQVQRRSVFWISTLVYLAVPIFLFSR